MLGGVVVLLCGIHLWMHGYQNGWVIAMIVIGTLVAITND